MLTVFKKHDADKLFKWVRFADLCLDPIVNFNMLESLTIGEPRYTCTDSPSYSAGPPFPYSLNAQMVLRLQSLTNLKTLASFFTLILATSLTTAAEFRDLWHTLTMRYMLCHHVKRAVWQLGSTLFHICAFLACRCQNDRLSCFLTWMSLASEKSEFTERSRCHTDCCTSLSRSYSFFIFLFSDIDVSPEIYLISKV